MLLYKRRCSRRLDHGSDQCVIERCPPQGYRRAGGPRADQPERAATEYLERARKTREEADRRARMQEACRRMDELAKKLGAWDPVKVIRRARDARRRAA